MPKHAKKKAARAEDALLKEIYAKYNAAQPEPETYLLRQEWVKGGVYAILVFLAVFIASSVVFPLLLGPAEPVIASALGLHTVVPLLSLFSAMAALLAFFQLKLANKPV